MTQDTMHLLARFRSEVPLPDAETTRRVYARAVGERVAGVRGREPRRRLMLAVAVGVLVFAAAAVAAVREVPWWQSGEAPVDPRAVASVARDNMPADVRVADARTVATDGEAALVAVPLGSTGYCLIPAVGRQARLGASCVYEVRTSRSGDYDLMKAATQPARSGADAHWLVFGHVGDERAATIDLGRMTLRLSPGGFFVADVPLSKWQTLTGTADAARVRDASGSVLRSGCVNWGAAPAAEAKTTASTPLWAAPVDGTCVPQAAPRPPSVDLEHARELLEVKLALPFSIWKAGETVTFKAAPASDGTTCVTATGARLPAPAQGCSSLRLLPRTTTKERPIDVRLGATLAHDGGEAFYAWEVEGVIDPSAGVAKVELRSPGRVVPMALAGGFFFGQLPETTPGPRQGAVPLPTGPWSIVGLDGAGAEVARVDLDALLRRASPR
jgi:hypothetical protein